MLTLPQPTLNYGTPVNGMHPLNRGLSGWWKVLPLRSSGLLWSDLVGVAPGTRQGMGAGSGTSGWGATTRRGGFGEMRFDGTDDYVSLPAVPGLDPPALTLACWPKGGTGRPPIPPS